MKRKSYVILNKHLELVGRHAFLSASKYHWVNYDDDKLESTFTAAMAAARGDRLHTLAHDLIREGVKLPRNQKTLNMYVNDAIGYRMTPEQPLYYSENCFGTADALGFKRNFLRIHDLKTGVTPCKVTQLEIYAALFCLEYRFRPFDIETELRIYQNDEVQVYEADPDVIFHIMDKIVSFDKRINAIKEEVLS
jgi:hypothetical protein